MTKERTYFIFILTLLIKSSIFAIEPTIDTSKIIKITTFNNDRFELLKRIIYSVELQNFEIEEIALNNFTDFEFEGTEMGDGWQTITAYPVIEVSFTKKDQISFAHWYGKVTAYMYKDNVQRQKLVDFIDSSYHDPTIDYKFFLLCSHLMEKNDTIRLEISKNLLNELSSKDSLPELFTNFIDIPDFINTTNIISYTENSPDIYVSYKKHHKVLLSSIHKNKREYTEVISVQFQNPQISENIIKWAYISKFHEEFLQVYDPVQSNLDLREFNVLNYSGCFKEVKETMTVLGHERITTISFLHDVYFIFHDYVIYLELPETKNQITNEEFFNWKYQIQIVLEQLNPWIRNLENNKICN